MRKASRPAARAPETGTSRVPARGHTIIPLLNQDGRIWRPPTALQRSRRLAIDYDFPAWATEYMARVEAALGDAYSEPAADVRGYIDYVKSQTG
jgi:hypothetical protein